jgi:hypothetical protein
MQLHHFHHHANQEAHHPEIIDMKKKCIHQITANNSTEGADEKIPVLGYF